MAVWRKSILSKENSSNQQPKVGPCVALACWRSSKISVDGAKGSRGRGREGSIWKGYLTIGTL